MTEEKRLALVPALDEAPRVGAVVEGARRHLPVIVVDDGSLDGTADEARAAGAEVLRHPEPRGKGEALRTGFRHALDRGVEAVITLDGDGQHDPAEVPEFLEAWRATGADLVIGARDFRSMPPTRRVANILGRRVLRWATGVDVPDNRSGYRLVSRRLMVSPVSAADPAGPTTIDGKFSVSSYPHITTLRLVNLAGFPMTNSNTIISIRGPHPLFGWQKISMQITRREMLATGLTPADKRGTSESSSWSMRISVPVLKTIWVIIAKLRVTLTTTLV